MDFYASINSIDRGIAMLDYRHQTFLVLCRIGSYTQAAKVLNLTQPAVTQHIKALEAHYGSPLFTYANRTLTSLSTASCYTSSLLEFPQTATS